MTIQPIGAYEEGVDNVDNLARLDDAQSSESGTKPAQSPRPELPQASIAHMASYDTRNFSVDKPEHLRQHLADLKKNERLKAKSTDADKIVFSQFVDSEDEEQVREAARNFYYLLGKGYRQESAMQFRQMSPALQENIGYALLQQFDGKTLRSELLELFKGNAQISKELKDLAAEKLAEPKNNPFAGALNIIKAKVSEAYEAVNNVQMFQDKPEFLALEKLIYKTGDTKLIQQYECLKRFILDAQQNIQQETESFRHGQTSAAELAWYLDGVVLGTSAAYLAFSAMLQAYQDTDFSELQSGMENAMDRNNQAVSLTMRDIYAWSNGKVVLRLSEAACVLINESLRSLGAAPLELCFADTEETPLNLREVTQTCYEYTDQYEPQIRDAFELVLSIFRSKSRDVEQWKQSQLEELRKLEDYLEKVSAALREFYKKLDDSKNLKKLETIQIVINSCARGISALEDRLNSNVPMNKSVASVLAKYRVQYESERWQKVKELICA